MGRKPIVPRGWVAAGTMQELLDLSDEALDINEEAMNPSFDLNSIVKSDPQHQIETVSSMIRTKHKDTMSHVIASAHVIF